MMASEFEFVLPEPPRTGGTIGRALLLRLSRSASTRFTELINRILQVVRLPESCESCDGIEEENCVKTCGTDVYVCVSVRYIYDSGTQKPRTSIMIMIRVVPKDVLVMLVIPDSPLPPPDSVKK